MQSIGVKVYIDGAGEFKNDLSTMTQATKTFKSELDAINKSDMNPFEKASLSKSALSKEIEAQEQKITLLKEKLEKTAEKYGENSTQAMKVTEQIEKANAALSTMKQQLENIKNPIQIIGDEMKHFGDNLERKGQEIARVGDTISKVSLPIAAGFAAATKGAIDFESAMTGVKKTVDETDTTKYTDLENAIKHLAGETGVAKEEIAGVMENAGQLGVSADNIIEFTRTMIDLGVSTNLTAEEASSAMAKFANVTKMPLDSVGQLGAALVDLGNNYATTEADIMSMATRLSGAGAQIGLTQGEILGFATALSSVGIEAEMGGSAFSKAMIKMQVAAETGWDQVIDLQNKTGMSLRELDLLSQNNSKDFKALADSLGMTKGEMQATVTAGKNLENFAEVAGMSTKQFVELYRTDAPAALQAFISGLGDTEKHGETTIAMLQEMGFTEVRLRDTLTRLAQSSGLVTDAVAQGNKAWEENAALSEEAGKRYATTENQIAALKERLGNLGIEIGERLLPYIDKFIDFADRMIAKWDGLGKGTQDLILKAGMFVAVAGPLLSVGGRLVSGVGILISGVGSLVSGIGGIIGTAGTLAGIGTSIVSGIATIGGGIGGLITAIGGGATGLIGAIGAILPAVAPFLIGGAVIAGIALGAYEIIKHWDEIKDAAGKLADTVSKKWEEIKENTHEAWNNIKQTISENWENIKTNTKETVEAIGSKISQAWNDIKTTTINVWNNVKDTISGVAKNMKDTIANAARSMWDSISNTFSDLAENAWNWGSSMINKLGDGINNAWGWVESSVSGMRNFFANTLGNLASDAWNWGADMIQNIKNGIESKLNSVKNAASTIADAIKSRLHFSVPDEGPLSDADTYMPDMMKLYAEGIYKNIGIVDKAADAIAAALVPNYETGAINSGRSTSITNGDTVINVYGAAGQDVNELADIVMRKLTIQTNRQAVVYG